MQLTKIYISIVYSAIVLDNRSYAGKEERPRKAG